MERKFMKMKYTFIFVVVSTMMLSGNGVIAEEYDWPQYHGPKRDRISQESDWNRTLEEAQILWEQEVGFGFSSMSVSDGFVYTMGNIDDQDYVWCFEADTGEKVWFLPLAKKAISFV